MHYVRSPNPGLARSLSRQGGRSSRSTRVGAVVVHRRPDRSRGRNSGYGAVCASPGRPVSRRPVAAGCAIGTSRFDRYLQDEASVAVSCAAPETLLGEVVFVGSQIAAAVGRLAAAIRRDYAGEQIMLVGVLKG